MNFLFHRLWAKYKKIRNWRKYGNSTFYHIDDGQTVFVDGVETYGVPIIHQYDNECTLHIGRYCSIAAGCQIVLGGNHHTKWISTYAFYQELDKFPSFSALGKGNSVRRGDIVIGNDVWIGRNVLILPGSHIGDGSVIGQRRGRNHFPVQHRCRQSVQGGKKPVHGKSNPVARSYCVVELAV